MSHEHEPIEHLKQLRLMIMTFTRRPYDLNLQPFKGVKVKESPGENFLKTIWVIPEMITPDQYERIEDMLIDCMNMEDENDPNYFCATWSEISVNAVESYLSEKST